MGMGVPKLIEGNGQGVPANNKGASKEAKGFMWECPGTCTSFIKLYTIYLIVKLLLLSCMSTNSLLLYLCSFNIPPKVDKNIQQETFLGFFTIPLELR